jgi:lysophospholipase L1-like esterase
MPDLQRRAAAALTLACVLAPVLGLSACDSGDGGSDEPRRARDGRAVVAVIGDSYMAGFGVTDADQGMAVLMANGLGMDLVNVAVGSTGYLDGGLSGNQTYAVQASSAIAADANLSVVEGALNDWQLIYQDAGGDLDKLADAAKDLYARLVEQAGKDNVIVVGPIWPTDTVDPTIYDVDDVLKREATLAGLDYIDPLEENWINPSNNDQYIGPDGAHPNALGHLYIARKLADAIKDAR